MLSLLIPPGLIARLGYSPGGSVTLRPLKLVSAKTCHVPEITLADVILSFQKFPTFGKSWVKLPEAPRKLLSAKTIISALLVLSKLVSVV
jgi:hypothetical protein